MERELSVFVHTDGKPMPVGRLFARARGNRESASFEYDAGWLSQRSAFGLDPELPLAVGPFHTERALFNAFADASPDRWGQMLLRRHEQARARREQRPARTLLAVDFLALVDDETRLGALRFRNAGSELFIATDVRPVPPLVALGHLLAATTRVEDDRETEADLRLLLAPGTSLGGARPKASVRDPTDSLWVAKLPRRDDEWPVTRWEAVALQLASDTGIAVPEWRLQVVAKRAVLLTKRFDRTGSKRIPFMSALTALSARDMEPHGYVEIAEALRRDGANPAADLRELFRRMVFNVLVSNTDDHLRNHGLLRVAKGWRLSPAYDMNPTPADVKPRVHALALHEHHDAASLETALAAAPAFGLRPPQARSVAAEVGRGVARWRTVAARLGVTPRQIERMQSAFEHEDLAAARTASARATGRRP